MVRRANTEAARLQAPLIRLWDGGFTLRGEVAGWREVDYEFIENDTGTCTLKLSLGHYLAKWVMSYPSNWRNIVKPFPLLADNSNLTIVFSRFKSWHEVAQKDLKDAQRNKATATSGSVTASAPPYKASRSRTRYSWNGSRRSNTAGAQTVRKAGRSRLATRIRWTRRWRRSAL
jgi:hypothetical protein